MKEKKAIRARKNNCCFYFSFKASKMVKTLDQPLKLSQL